MPAESRSIRAPIAARRPIARTVSALRLIAVRSEARRAAATACSVSAARARRSETIASAARTAPPAKRDEPDARVDREQDQEEDRKPRKVGERARPRPAREAAQRVERAAQALAFVRRRAGDRQTHDRVVDRGGELSSTARPIRTAMRAR